MTDIASSPLSRARCLNHPEREAVGRCPDCGHFFCRECLIEHEGRMTCASCLAEQTDAISEEKKGGRLGTLVKSGLSWLIALACFWMVWGAFYLLGRLLLFMRHEWEDLLL